MCVVVSIHHSLSYTARYWICATKGCGVTAAARVSDVIHGRPYKEMVVVLLLVLLVVVDYCTQRIAMEGDPMYGFRGHPVRAPREHSKGQSSVRRKTKKSKGIVVCLVAVQSCTRDMR